MRAALTQPELTVRAAKRVPGWRYARIRDLANVVRGASPRPAGDPSLFDGDFLPWITVGDLTGTPGPYLQRTESRLTEKGAKQTRVLPPNTLLLANSGATLGVPKITCIEAGANDGVAALLDLKEVSREFAYFVLETQTRYLREVVAPGLGQPNLNTDLIGQLIIAVPPEPVQERIVRVGLTLVTAIRLLQELIAAKRAFRTGLIQRLTTGKRRFREFIQSDEKQPGQFGVVPRDWTVGPIAGIAQEVKIRGDIAGDVVYSCTKHAGLVPSLEYFGRQVFSRDLNGYKRLQEGDFAYATNHIEEGSIGLLRRGQQSGLVSPMYTVFRAGELVNPEFLFAVLKTESYRRVFERRMSASVDRRGSLRWDDFSQIRIGLPSLEEQNRIADVLRVADLEIDQLRQLLDLVGTQKRGLLTKLLTGEIYVEP